MVMAFSSMVSECAAVPPLRNAAENLNPGYIRDYHEIGVEVGVEKLRTGWQRVTRGRD
jgi:hypothetical protein